MKDIIKILDTSLDYIFARTDGKPLEKERFAKKGKEEGIFLENLSERDKRNE